MHMSICTICMCDPCRTPGFCKPCEKDEAARAQAGLDEGQPFY